MFIPLILSLFFITYLDFKERKVYLINLIITGVLLGYLFFKNSFSIIIFIQEILINIILVITLLSFLYAYTKIKIKKDFKEALGLGDIIFFFSIAIGFPTLSFLVIFFSSIIFSQVIFLILFKKEDTVPLAGLQSLFLFIILIINYIFTFINLYAM